MSFPDPLQGLLDLQRGTLSTGDTTLGSVHACLQMEDHMRSSSRRRGGRCRHSSVWSSFPSARTRDIPEVLWSKTTLYQTCSAARSRIVVHDRSLCVLACFLISIGRSNYVKVSHSCPPLMHGASLVNGPDLILREDHLVGLLIRFARSTVQRSQFIALHEVIARVGWLLFKKCQAPHRSGSSWSQVKMLSPSQIGKPTIRGVVLAHLRDDCRIAIITRHLVVQRPVYTARIRYLATSACFYHSKAYSAEQLLHRLLCDMHAIM